MLVVDDSTPDGTAEVAKAVGDELGCEEVLLRPGKWGLGSAYRAGFREGLARGYDVLVEMDSDLSHDPAELPALLRPLDQGAALVVGSRYVSGGAASIQGLAGLGMLAAVAFYNRRRRHSAPSAELPMAARRHPDQVLTAAIDATGSRSMRSSMPTTPTPPDSRNLRPRSGGTHQLDHSTGSPLTGQR